MCQPFASQPDSSDIMCQSFASQPDSSDLMCQPFASQPDSSDLMCQPFASQPDSSDLMCQPSASSQPGSSDPLFAHAEAFIVNDSSNFLDEQVALVLMLVCLEKVFLGRDNLVPIILMFFGEWQKFILHVILKPPIITSLFIDPRTHSELQSNNCALSWTISQCSI